MIDRWLGLVLVLTMLIPLGLAAGGPIRAADDFESGSLGRWRIEGETRLVLTPRLEFDQDSVNSAMTWFCGRLENVLQREVTIELTGLNYTVYNGQVGNILPFERNTVNYFSYDREEWHRFTCREFDQEARTFRLRQIFTRDTVWIAYTIPYPLTRLERLLTEVEGHPAVRLDTLGRSVEGRPLHLVTVAEPGLPVDSRPVVWLAARQHAFESGGSWALEGLLRFLASADPEASRLRRRLTFRLCPLLNPDGVAHGHTRFNARGVDLNRHWHPRDPLSRDRELAPEIVLFKQALGKWRQDHRLDLFINLHNNDMVWNEDGDYIRFAPLEREDQARRLEKILREELVFTGPFFPSENPEATERVVSEEFGPLSLLMEMKTGYLEGLGRWTGQDIFLETGRGLARAAAKLLAE